MRRCGRPYVDSTALPPSTQAQYDRLGQVSQYYVVVAHTSSAVSSGGHRAKRRLARALRSRHCLCLSLRVRRPKLPCPTACNVPAVAATVACTGLPNTPSCQPSRVQDGLDAAAARPNRDRSFGRARQKWDETRGLLGAPLTGSASPSWPALALSPGLRPQSAPDHGALPCPHRCPVAPPPSTPAAKPGRWIPRS
jgi:hypothetical protein